MQRALLCSYNWTNNTLYRETVLRMETRAYWKMSPVARVRLSLQTGAKLDERTEVSTMGRRRKIRDTVRFLQALDGIYGATKKYCTRL